MQLTYQANLYLKLLWGFALFMASSITLNAQYTTDGAYKMPLKDVLSDIQKRFNVTIKYTDSLVAGKGDNCKACNKAGFNNCLRFSHSLRVLY